MKLSWQQGLALQARRLQKNPAYMVAVIAIILLLALKALFTWASASGKGVFFAWIYSPLGAILSLWRETSLEYSGIYCNYNFGGSDLILSGCAASGVFLAAALLGSAVFVSQKASSLMKLSSVQPKPRAWLWRRSLRAIALVLALSYLWMLAYNAYIMFLSPTVNLWLFLRPSFPKLPYSDIIKFALVFLSGLCFYLLFRPSRTAGAKLRPEEESDGK